MAEQRKGKSKGGIAPDELARRVASSPAQWHAVMLAVARLEEAGGRVDDLPAAVEEWTAAHLGGARRKLARAIREHLADLEAQGRAHSTVRNRRWRLETLLDEVGNRRIGNLSRGMIAGWIAGAAPGSRRDRHAAASAFFRWAWERGYVRTNPVDGLRAPARPPTPAPRVLNPEEARTLLRTVLATEPDMALYFAVGLFGGLRPVRELAGLEWSDVDLSERRIYVPYGRTKTGRARIVPISHNLAAWLSRVPRAERQGKVCRYTREGFRRVVEAWGMPWSTNLMRHTRVSYRLAQCRNPVLVAAEGGHTQEVMHRHYANLRIKASDVSRFWGLTPSRVRG
jgi:integrase